MPSHILYLLVTLTLASSHASWAQTYRYQTPDGRWIISNTPPADDAEVVTKIPEGSGPSMQTTIQVPSQNKAMKPVKNQDIRKAAHRHNRDRHRLMQTSRPVNTHQFGLLEIGSTQADVLRVLGPPADKVKQGRKERIVHLKERYVQRKVKIETWYYPGSNRLRPTRLVFYDGLLGEKDKGEREGHTMGQRGAK
jgi:hypothetical protein